MTATTPICGFNGNSEPTCREAGTHSLAKVNDSPYWFLTRSRHTNALCETHARQLLTKWNSK